MSLRGWRLFGVAGTIIVYVVGLLILSIISLNKQTNQRPTTDELFKETDSSDIVKSIPNTTNQIGEIQSLKWCQPLRYLDSDDIKDITIKSTKLMQTFYGHDVRISKKYSQNRNGDHSNKSQCIEPIFEKASRSASNDEMKINYHEELWGNDLKALASFPGSGNTWLRYLLQQVTGIYTGSVYLDTELLKGGFSAENIVDSSVLVIKTHEWGPIAWKHFAKAILLVRDPGKAILAEFNRQTGGHIGFASPDQYNSTKGSYWQQFVAYQLCAWEQMNLQWAKNFTGEVEVIYYEDLEEDVEGVLRQILTFINYPLNEDLLNCALTRKKGIYHRKKPLMTFDPFTPEMHKAIEEKKREVYAELRRVLSIVTLVVLTVGLGCRGASVMTYGGQQYKPSEVKSIALYFALFYFVLNVGSVISRFVNPILRQDVKCFGNDDCFALAFGIPGIFLVLMTLTIMVAKRYSETSQAKGNTLLNVFACIWHAIVMRIKSRKSINPSKKNHWLDYSEEKYGKVLIKETRDILNVFVLFLPISLFWALFYQQGSRWVFQAVRMNGSLGFYTIKPDQLNVLNPILDLILIPTFEYVFYPLLLKVGIRTALRKATLGGVLGGVAFLISAIIESQIDEKYLHMSWLIPQYFFMAMAEILISIPMMNFAYLEGPPSMKTILLMYRMLAIGLGNLIVIIVAGSKLIDSQIYEFILFAGLMFVDMIIFGFLASRYKPKQLNADELIENEYDNSKTI